MARTLDEIEATITELTRMPAADEDAISAAIEEYWEAIYDPSLPWTPLVCYYGNRVRIIVETVMPHATREEKDEVRSRTEWELKSVIGELDYELFEKRSN